MDVSTYTHEYNGLNFNVIDTPGLCDDLPEAGNDARYLQKIKQYVNKVDVLLFVTRLDETRISSDEIRGIRAISEALGAQIWDNSLITFTHSDKVSPEKFEEKLNKRTELIRNTISKSSNADTKNIPSVAVCNNSDILPNGQPWLGEFFTQVVLRLKDDATLSFLNSIGKDAGKETTGKRIEINEAQKEKIKETTVNRFIDYVKVGGMLGETIGNIFGATGKIIGKAIGSVLGGIFGWLFD